MIEELPASARIRRRAYLGAAATILPFWGVDLAIEGAATWPCLAIRLAWAGTFLAAAAVCGRVRERTLDRMAVGAALITAASMTGILALTGGAGGPYVFAMPLLPVLIAVVEPSSEAPAWVGGVASAAGFAWVGFATGSPPASTAAGVAGTLAATAWSTFGFRESRRVRQAAIEASGLAAIGRLAAGVAHEINNPLAFAKANVVFLRDSLPEGPAADEERQAADEALVGLERIRGIVLDLRGFAREASEPAVPVASAAPAEAVEEALRLSSLHLRSRVRVTRDLADDLPRLALPRSRLVQILVNLLVNAADALEGRPQGEVRVGAEVRGDRLVVTVEDNGPGVRPHQRKLLFRPFHTTKPPGKGLGLGLPLSRDLAARVGGTLRYEDRPGGGARFVLELPVARTAAAS